MGVSHITTGKVRSVAAGLSPKGLPRCIQSFLFVAACLAGCASTATPLTLPSVSIQDPAFRTSLEAFAGAPIVGDNRVDILLNGEQTFPALLKAIRSARVTVTFEAYIFHEGKVADEIVHAFVDRCRAGVHVSMLLDAHGAEGEQLTRSLLEATQRGVRVRVLVPSVERGSGVEFVTQASQRDVFGPLLDGGIQLHEYTPALLHTKMMIVDGVWATVGSANFDNRSMAMNDELNVMFYDQTIAKRLEEIFVEDITHSNKLTREQLEHRQWLHRALSVLMSPFRAWF